MRTSCNTHHQTSSSNFPFLSLCLWVLGGFLSVWCLWERERGGGETHWAGLIGDMTGEGTPTKHRHHHHHHHPHYHHPHYHHQHHHRHHHHDVDTQGDYVGSVHQSSGGFHTAGSPICANTKWIYIFLFYFAMQAMQAVLHVNIVCCFHFLCVQTCRQTFH